MWGLQWRMAPVNTMAHDANLYENEMNNIARKKNDVARLELK